MMVRPIHGFLEELGSPPAKPLDLPAVAWPSAKVEPKTNPSGLQHQIDEAHASGFQAGMLEAASGFSAERDRLEAEMARRLQEKDAALANLVAVQFSDCHRHLETLQHVLSDRLTSALLPIMRHVITESAIAELAASVRALTCNRKAMSLELSGPPELVERVRDLLSRSDQIEPDAKPEIRIVHGAALEVRVVVDDTALETRIMEWIGRIMEAAG